MLTVEEIVKRLGDRNIREVARRTNIDPQSLGYFYRHKGGKRVRPELIEALSDYLEGENGENGKKESA